MPKTPQQRGRASRNKGKVGEREAVKQCIEHWGADPDKCRRSAQVDGGLTSDIVGALPGFHVEVKRRKSIGALRFMDQAREDVGETELPLVLMREDGDPLWFCLFAMKDSEQFASSLFEQISEQFS